MPSKVLIDIASGAKSATSYLAIVGTGGDGVISPTFGAISFEFR